jgi:hypothetical protein
MEGRLNLLSLLDFQIALGRAVRRPSAGNPLRGLNVGADERAGILAIINSRGFRFTADVQRSWSIGRATNAARFTLSHLPVEKRDRLLDEWVSAGGSTGSFFDTDAHAFLDFIARHLPDPSHELTLCQVERATLRAGEGFRVSAPTDLSALDSPGCALVAGQYATRVAFHTEPRLLFAAPAGQPLPPLSSHVIAVLFAPCFDGFFHIATPEEDELWRQLSAPITPDALLRQGFPRKIIEAFLLAGCAEVFNLPPVPSGVVTTQIVCGGADTPGSGANYS